MDDRIKLSKEKKDQMISAIKEFFLDKRGEDLGDLAATFVLDFFVKELAPGFYNQGVYDAYNYLKDRLDDVFELQIF